MSQSINRKFLDRHPYLHKCFNTKTLITKGIIFACAAVLVLSLSLSFYFWLKDMEPGTEIIPNPFCYIHVCWNGGMGWSTLDGNTAAIYAIQSIVFLVLTSLFVFLTNSRVVISFISLAMLGGLFNLIQRAATPVSLAMGGVPSVLDYLTFGFWPGFPIFNWPDSFVVIGVLGFVISYITVTIIDAKNEGNKKHNG